jgi:hypothetical protein
MRHTGRLLFEEYRDGRRRRIVLLGVGVLLGARVAQRFLDGAEPLAGEIGHVALANHPRPLVPGWSELNLHRISPPDRSRGAECS